MRNFVWTGMIVFFVGKTRCRLTFSKKFFKSSGQQKMAFEDLKKSIVIINFPYSLFQLPFEPTIPAKLVFVQ